MKLQIIQNIIDILRAKKRNKIRKKAKNYFENFEKKIEQIKNKKKIKVAFLQNHITAFQNFCIFEKMLKDNMFDPYFIANPDVYRSAENRETSYAETLKELKKQYGDRVLEGYKNGEFIDYTNDFDIATTSCPYDCMSHDYFKIDYWAQKNIPIFFIPYFYMGKNNTTKWAFKLDTFNYFWKIFVENKNTYKMAKKYQIIKGKNIVITGYPKMDSLYKTMLNTACTTENKKRKLIIISPHHSVVESNMSLSGFLNYWELLIDLPKKYPEIDFIFRPHPLLFEDIKKIWTKEQIQSFIEKITSNKNLYYSKNENYFEYFAKSDALIHDCDSFSSEYLYTGKPCAFLLKNNFVLKKHMTSFGRKCINAHYLLKKPADIFRFIDDIVIGGNDYKKEKRMEFAKKEVMVNYPNAADIIFNNIKSYLRNDSFTE